MVIQRHRRDRMAMLDFADPSITRNPYPAYAVLRSTAPVHALSSGAALVLGWEHCHDVLRSSAWSSDTRNAIGAVHTEDSASWGVPVGVRPELFFDVPEPGPRPFLFLDPPDHTRLRRLVSAAFTPRAIEALRPTIEGIAARLLDAALGAERFDAVAELAYPLPVEVICRLLGVDDDRTIVEWAPHAARIIEPASLLTAAQRERTREAALTLGLFFGGVIAERRARPRDDVLSALIAAGQAGDDDMIATCVFLLVAGHETTVNLIANALVALARHPDQFSLLRQHVSLPGAVDEFLRYDAPVQVAARTALTDVKLNGVRVAAGRQAILVLGAANRDPARFAHPDTLDLARPDAKFHLAFAAGPHYCLGAPLARLETEVVLRAFAARVSAIALDGEPTYRAASILRGPTSLPLRVAHA